MFVIGPFLQPVGPAHHGSYRELSCRSPLSARAGLNSATRPLLPITPIPGGKSEIAGIIGPHRERKPSKPAGAFARRLRPGWGEAPRTRSANYVVLNNRRNVRPAASLFRPDWAHEIKHDGYGLMVRRNGLVVRLYSRNAIDLSARLSAIATAAARIKAKTFTIDGEAVVRGPDGLSRFDELPRREAARTAIRYAFDLIEHDSEDLRNLPFLDRKAALARLLPDTEQGILLNEHVAENCPTVFTSSHTLAGLGRRHRLQKGR